jgi:hypothetical protein
VEPPPAPIRELLWLLHYFGALRLMAAGCEPAVTSAGTPLLDRVPRFRDTVRLFCPSSDVLSLLSRLPPLEAVRDRPSRLLFYIQDRTAKLASLSETAARLASAIDGRRTGRELEAYVSERPLESGALIDRRQIATILQDLTERQALEWFTPKS